MSLFEVTSIADTCTWANADDPTKRIIISAAGIGSGTTRTLTIPNTDGTLTVDGAAATMTAKTITDADSNVIARGLWIGSGSGSVSIYGSAPPVAGQVLRATGATDATWQDDVAPGGTSGAIQYNNGGVFAGSTAVGVAADGLLELDATSLPPAVAASGTVKLFGVDTNMGVGPRIGWMGQDAISYGIVGQALWNVSPAWMFANGRNTTAILTNRMGTTGTGTATGRGMGTATKLDSSLRVGYTSATTAGSSAGWRSALLTYWRGDKVGFGGWTFSIRFGMSSTAAVATQRSFVGLYASTNAFPNSDPGSTTGAAFVGFGSNSADTNWSPMCTSGGAVTTIAPGVSISAKTLGTELLEFGLFCRPNDTVIYWSMYNISTGVRANGTFTTNLPPSATFMSPIAQTNNGTTALAVRMDIVSAYAESPY